LENIDAHLKELGYRKYNQKLKHEDFAYWKTYKDNEGKELYQIGLLVYDFRRFEPKHGVSVQFECVLYCDERIDLTVSDDITLEKFEAMSEDFYHAMKKHYKK
jgi:hypothetical protein